MNFKFQNKEVSHSHKLQGESRPLACWGNTNACRGLHCKFNIAFQGEVLWLSEVTSKMLWNNKILSWWHKTKENRIALESCVCCRSSRPLPFRSPSVLLLPFDYYCNYSVRWMREQEFNTWHLSLFTFLLLYLQPYRNWLQMLLVMSPISQSIMTLYLIHSPAVT